jgi:hypothetical protein
MGGCFQLVEDPDVLLNCEVTPMDILGTKSVTHPKYTQDIK